MKRFICCLLVCCLFMTVLPFSAKAEENETEIIYLDDGGYIIVTIDSVSSRASGTKTGSKTYTYTNSSGTGWKAVLSGTFTYTGSSATCTSSSCDVTVYMSDWYTVSKSAGRSGNSATASIKMGRKVMGVTVETVPISMKLTCDANGNLS